MTHTVVCQRWTESDRWSGRSSAGYSIHLTDKDRAVFVKTYNDSLPSQVPEAYDFADGEPFLVDIDQEAYDEIKASVNGVRKYGSMPERN